MALDFFSKLSSLFSSDKRIDISRRFEILREAVAGTMSNFHMVRDITNGKTVGLKLLDIEKTAQFEGRFKALRKPSEGEIGLKLKHPRIVETYECGETKTGQQYILMEYLEGTGLNVLIQDKSPLLNDKRLMLIKNMIESIDVLHKAGYIHRDICPRNFIVAPDGKSLKLIDFGLTLPAQKEYMQPGNRTGTPLYMAPEIVRRRPTDHRLDLFSFGVTAFYLLAGEHPWPTVDTTGKGALQHDTQPPGSLTDLRPKVNRLPAKTIHQCLAANPQDRPASAEKIIQTLRPITHEDAKEPGIK